MKVIKPAISEKITMTAMTLISVYFSTSSFRTVINEHIDARRKKPKPTRHANMPCRLGGLNTSFFLDQESLSFETGVYTCYLFLLIVMISINFQESIPITMTKGATNVIKYNKSENPTRTPSRRSVLVRNKMAYYRIVYTYRLPLSLMFKWTWYVNSIVSPARTFRLRLLSNGEKCYSSRSELLSAMLSGCPDSP